MKPIDACRYDGTGKRVESVKAIARLSCDRVSLIFRGEKTEKHYDMTLDDWLILIGAIEQAQGRLFRSRDELGK